MFFMYVLVLSYNCFVLAHSEAVYGVCFKEEEKEVFASASEVVVCCTSKENCRFSELDFHI